MATFASYFFAGFLLNSSFSHVNVFQAGEGGWRAFRIPEILQAPDGSLLAFAEARKYSLRDPGGEGQEIDLVVKRSEDHGKTWSELCVIEHAGPFWSSANPCAVVDRKTGTIWLFYLRCKPGRSTFRARGSTKDVVNLVRQSNDNGKTWSKPLDLTEICRDMTQKKWGISVPGPGGAIQDSKGRLLVPFWSYAPWRNFVVFSEDHGKSWQRGNFVSTKRAGNENQLVELPNGKILMDIRQCKGPRRWVSLSNDGGRSWSEPFPGQEVTPVCCAVEGYAQQGKKKEFKLLWTGPKGPGRKNLVLRVSKDMGKTFSKEKLIYKGPAAYSNIATLKDGSIGVLWERDNYKFITFTRIEPEALSGED